MADTVRERLSREPVAVGFRAVDLASGEEIGMDADRVLPTASTIKVPLVVELFRRADAGDLDLDERMALEERHKTLPAGVLQRLGAGLALTLRDLAVLALIISDNTATEMLAERLGGACVVDAALPALGLPATRYAFGPHGMFLHGFGVAPEAGLEELERAAVVGAWRLGSAAFLPGPGNTVSTAQDLCGLMVRLERSEAASPRACREILATMTRQQYFERVASRLPPGAVACKTGTLGGVRADTGLIRGPRGRRVAYALLTFDSRATLPGEVDLSRARTAAVNAAFAEVGLQLWSTLT